MGLAKENVLLVDDEPQVLVALEDLLSEEFTVIKTESPEAALKLIRHQPDIAVVMSDQRMPRMNGDELLAKLITTSDAIRILVTGYADLSAVVRAVNDGRIFAYVTKPWNPEDLRLMVRKAAEHFRLAKELAQERQLLHDLMDNIPDGIYFKDRELRFLRANRAFADVVDAGAPESLVGHRLSEIVRARDAEAGEVEERGLLTRGETAQDVLREYLRGAETGWLSETKAPIRTPGGEVVGLVGIARDVTERVQTQETLRRLEQQLLQSQKMEAVGQLAGGVAHDFNNLLSVITGYAELVMQEIPEGDPKHTDLGELLAAAQRAAALTRQLLAFSRRQAVQPVRVQLNDVVSNLEKMLRRIIGEDIDLDTVPGPELAIVRADPSQLEQVLLNLTVNARDAMPKGGKLTIETRNVLLDEQYAAEHAGVKPGPFVLLSVTDTGTGIDRETQKHIFEPFFTTKEVGKGTGLGLSTVYGIVQQCGGHIWVESELGQGTSFRIYLPPSRDSDPQALQKRPSALAPAAGQTVLVVEDEDAVRQVTARILRDQGYHVIEARRADEARSLCKRHATTIDLLLIDVVMPEVSGPALAAELVELAPRIHVLYMSGYSGGAIQAQALDVGLAYIEKPFTRDALARKIRDVLGSS